MAQENNPTGAKTLFEANVNTEFSSQTNILASMEGDVKTREILINQDSPSGTLERKESSSKRRSNMESGDGFQRFDNQEVSGIRINCCTFYIRFMYCTLYIKIVHILNIKVCKCLFL